MYRILLVGVALLVPTSLECQRLAPVPPYARSSIMVGPLAPRFDRVLGDRGFPRTYWFEGGVIGAITGGVLGTLWFRGMSESRHSLDRKSTRLNSSHTVISYAVFCLK